MDHWDELVRDYERSIVESRPQRAFQLLSELTLTAPASAVRRYDRILVDASKRCRDRRVRGQLTRTVELLRQRASITDSSLTLRSPIPEPSPNKPDLDRQGSEDGARVLTRRREAGAARLTGSLHPVDGDEPK